MGTRLTTPLSSESSSSTTAYRTTTSNSSTDSNHTRAHLNSTNHRYSQQQSVHHHHSNSGHHHSHGLFGNSSTNNRRRRTTTNLDSLSTAAFNVNLLRYVGLEHESDDHSSDDDSPQAHRNLQHFIISLRDIHCPVCNKTIPSDSLDKHILQCLSKPRIDYNG